MLNVCLLQNKFTGLSRWYKVCMNVLRNFFSGGFYSEMTEYISMYNSHIVYVNIGPLQQSIRVKYN